MVYKWLANERYKSRRYITISIAAFICYCNTLWGTFVFDDSEAIVKNKDVMPFTPIMDIFKNDFWGMDISLNSSHKSYRPLTILSYRLNVIYSNDKLDSFGFHATNVVLYGLLCILCVPIFELFLKKKKFDGDIDDVAYFSSLLFTVHPIHTEAVAGLVGRADILSSVLFFIAVLVYNRAIHSKSIKLILVVIITVGCAVLCKETAITALGFCILYDVYQEKRRKNRWRDTILNCGFIFRMITLMIAGLVILYYRFKVMNFEGPIFTSIDNPAAYSHRILTRVFTYNYIYFLNIALLIWPEWLCFDWSMGCVPLIESLCDIRIIFVLCFWCLTIITITSIVRKTLTTGLFDARIMGVTLLILPFLPASNLLFKVGFVIAERNLLLSSAGFCFLICLGYKKIENNSSNKQLCTTIFYGICILLAFKTIHRNFDWLNEERLFNSALEVCPLNAKVHYNVAKIAADRNRNDVALREYKQAIKLNPQYEQAMNNLANLLREDKKFREAEILLRRALKIRPNFAAAWMNLGIVLTNLNQTEEAEHCYKTAILHRNKYPDCYYNLGNLYLDLKRHDEALTAWEMAVLYRPSHVAAWSNTLVLLDSLKQYDEVLELGRTALMHNPKSAVVHFSLANTLGKVQQFEKAEGHFLEAISLNPLNALYHSNLGVLYHRWGKTDKARDMYKKALQLDPNMKSTEVNLKKLIAAQVD